MPDRRQSAGRFAAVGDQQLIEIAKALSLEAEILIMDEPTSALTETEVARLFRIIAGCAQRGVTILYISHKMDEVFELADRITVLRDGCLVRTVDRTANHAPRSDASDGRPRDRGDASWRCAEGRRAGAGSAEFVAPLARPCSRLAAQEDQFHAPPRRDSWLRGPDGRRPHRIARNACSARRQATPRATDVARRPAGAYSVIRPQPAGRASRW